MVIPTVHLNGTPGERLLENVLAARAAVIAARGALAAASPNARDYYVQSNDAFGRACDEHAARLQKIIEVCGELGELAIAIRAQLDERQRGKVSA